MKETYVEINLDNIGYNLDSIRKKYNDYKYYIAVIKSDAYGHGKYIVNEIYQKGISYVAVSFLNEALEIRKYNKEVSVLCLQPVNISDIDVAVNNNITIIVHDFIYLKKLLEVNIKKKLKVHMKIDSGMNRLGFKDKTEFKMAYNLINKTENLELEGLFSHFASVGIFDKRYDDQIDKFKDITSTIDLSTIPIVHMGSSSSLLAHPKIDFCNGIRFGMLLYGYNVSYRTSKKGLKNILRNWRNVYFQKKYNISKTFSNVEISLRPCMKMFTKVIELKEVKKDEYIGYGSGGGVTYRALEDIIVAILPVGYSNGILKNNNRFVMINNKSYEVIGEIGMNMCTIKVDKSVKTDDKVLLLGDEISLGKFSRFNENGLAQSLINVGCNNRRVYLKNNDIEMEE